MHGIILVGVDNTNTAFTAAEKAARFALGLEYELRVVSAYDAREAGIPPLQHGSSADSVESALDDHRKSIEQLREGAQAAANLVVNRLRKKFPMLNVSGKAIEGAPGPALIRESKTVDSQIVVVGNRNVQGFGRLLGSIATAVAREIHCDLYIVNTRNITGSSIMV